MPTPKIPLRPPKGKYKLTNEEMNCLAWHTLSGCNKAEAYRLFVRPDLVTSPAILKKYAEQFYNSTEVRNFLADYTRTLEGDTPEERKEQPKEMSREQRVATAVEKFTDKVVDKMRGDLDSVEEMDAIAKLADRVGVLADKEEHIEAPRRYLPARCKTDCKYCFWAEQVVKTGDAIDCCEYCKALAFAKERGFIYDPTKLLDMPYTEYTEVKNTKSDSDENT